MSVAASAPLAELRLALDTTESGYEARVLDSPFRGFSREPLSLAFDPAELDAFWHGLADRPDPDAGWREIGGRLFDALFHGALREAFERTRSKTDDRFRLRLVFQARDAGSRLLSLVPWEALWHEDDRLDLGQHRDLPLVRQIDAGNRPTRPLTASLPLRVLPAVAAPHDQCPFPLSIGEPAIRAGLAPMLAREEAVLFPVVRGTRDELRRALLRHQPHVLHFLGHGGFAGDQGLLAFERDSDATTDLVNGEGFTDLLRGVRSLCLVVLTSCRTARFGTSPFLSLTAATAAYSEVPAIVAMQSDLGFEAAELFTRSLYERIAERDDLDVAVSETRGAIARQSAHWLLPALFLSAPDGRLVPPAPERTLAAVPAPTAAPAAPDVVDDEPPLRIGIRSRSPHFPDLETSTDRSLSFLPHFRGRDVLDPALWHREIYPRLEELLLAAAAERQRLDLYFAGHQTLAFAAGWVLQAKSGLDVSIRQASRGARPAAWRLDDGRRPGKSLLWRKIESVAVDPAAGDLAVALSLTHPIRPAVEAHLAASGTPVHRLIAAEIAPRAGQQAVLGGEHARLLADDIAYHLMQRPPQERRGTLHLFAAAPNAFLFYLGQLARPFGRVQLYEYGFDETERPGEYVPSLALPPPG